MMRVAPVELSALRGPGKSRPQIVDRRADGLTLPPVAILGANCWASPGNPVAWRLAVRLHFHGRGPARRPIYYDQVGPDYEAAAGNLQDYLAGGMVTAIEIWHAQRLGKEFL